MLADRFIRANLVLNGECVVCAYVQGTGVRADTAMIAAGTEAAAHHHASSGLETGCAENVMSTTSPVVPIASAAGRTHKLVACATCCLS